MHERAKHFSIHHLFLLLKVQFIKCSAAARGDGGGDMDDQAQRSGTSAGLSFDNGHYFTKLASPQKMCINMHSLVCLHTLIHALVFL